MSARDTIDLAFVRIAATFGVPEPTVRAALDLPDAAGPLNHLLRAATAFLPLLDDSAPVVAAARDLHLDTLWSGELATCIASPLLQDETAPLPDTIPGGGLDPMHYPQEAHAAFEQGLLLKEQSASADLIVLWKRTDRVAIMHAHPEGFWEIAPDPATWITRFAELLESGQSHGLIEHRVDTFVAESGVDRFCVTLDPDGSPQVDDGLAANELVASRLLEQKKAGHSVRVDVARAIRARGQRPAEPDPIEATDPRGIKTRLQEIIESSGARTFRLTVGGESWSKLKPRKLLKKVSTIQAGRERGRSATVAAEGGPTAGALPDPIDL